MGRSARGGWGWQESLSHARTTRLYITFSVEQRVGNNVCLLSKRLLLGINSRMCCQDCLPL